MATSTEFKFHTLSNIGTVLKPENCSA